jgi:F0F1-type ATP synthase membrane subunit b/b'
MIKPFRKIMLGGLDNKIEEIKNNINLSLKSFRSAEKQLEESMDKTKDLDLKIKDIIVNAKSQSEMLSKSIIEKTNALIKSKEKNSLERIRQIEISAVQEIKSQASLKLNKILIDYFEKMPLENKKVILNKKVSSLDSFI